VRLHTLYRTAVLPETGWLKLTIVTSRKLAHRRPPLNLTFQEAALFSRAGTVGWRSLECKSSHDSLPFPLLLSIICPFLQQPPFWSHQRCSGSGGGEQEPSQLSPPPSVLSGAERVTFQQRSQANLKAETSGHTAL